MKWWRAGLARLGVRTPVGRDAVVAAVVGVLSLSRLLLALPWAGWRVPFSAGAVAGGYLLATADVATIAFRRRHPLAVLVVATVIPLVSGALPTRPPWIGLGAVVASYTVATLLPRRRAAIAITICMAVHAIGGVAVVASGGDLGGLLTFWGVRQGDLAQMIIATAAAYWLAGLIGSYVQTRRAYATELAARLARLEHEREERARAAVARERARIARELHDIAAHDLSAIVVQAGAVDKLLDKDPAAARAMLKQIRAQGRDTLAALRGLVGIMRADNADRETGPPGRPSLSQLEELIERDRDAGMNVDVFRRGTPEPLPLVIDIAAYRVIQEALTNARRHAPGATVTVTTDYDEEGLRVVVHNQAPYAGAGPAAAEVDGNGGHGLAGMRERVQHAGGTLVAGPAGDGGWRVAALFPAAGPEGR